MSTVKSKKLQVGTDATSSNNFTIYQPATPDGTLRIGVGNADNPTEVAQFTSAGIVSGVSKLDTATGSAPSYSARAWVNFNGTGTVAIRSSGNVSSITDLATGAYFVNFSTAMPDTNYSVCVTSGFAVGISANTYANINTDSGIGTTSFRIECRQANTSTVQDSNYLFASIFR